MPRVEMMIQIQGSRLRPVLRYMAGLRPSNLLAPRHKCKVFTYERKGAKVFKAGAKCFRSCDNEVLVMLIAVYGMMGCEEWNRSEPGPGSSTAPKETIALMSRVLAVVPGAWCGHWPV